MLRDRLLYGPVFIAALIGLVWGDHAIAQSTGVEAALIYPAMLALAVLAALEFTAMVRARGVAISRGMTVFAVALGVTVSSFTPDDLQAISGVAVACTAAGVVLVSSMAYSARKKSAEGVVGAAAATVMAFVYIGLLAGFFVVLAKDYSGWLVLGVLLTTKSCDIGAYFTGSAIGKHKLIVWLSPKKTWEGLAGGVLTSTLVGALIVWLSPPAYAPLEVWHGAVLGCTFGLVGQAGDLTASLVKRDTGFKDASKTLPGFGGVLDVVDSPLLVAPVAYWMLNMFSGHASFLS
ncbi:MAG: phosphatidate cytidylyltransferase [Phycisphaerales bacterium]